VYPDATNENSAALHGVGVPATAPISRMPYNPVSSGLSVASTPG